MEKQKKMLRMSIAFMMHSNRSMDSLCATTEKHSKKLLDIKPHLYSVWLDCMVEAVKLTDPEFDEDIEESWRIIMQPGINYMIDKYDET